MLRLTGFWLRGRMMFGREPETEQLDVEPRDHRVPQTDERVAAGVGAEEAGCTALRAFRRSKVNRGRLRAAGTGSIGSPVGALRVG